MLEATAVSSPLVQSSTATPSIPEAPPSSNGGSGRPHLVKSGLCWSVLRQRQCKLGDECKSHHLTLNELLVSKLSLSEKDQDTSSPTKQELDVFARVFQKKIEKALYKTRLCHAFADGTCKYGSRCVFAHVTGPDAKIVLAQATSSKFCPWEINLGDCPQRICFFMHSKRKSTPLLSFNAFFNQESHHAKPKRPKVESENFKVTAMPTDEDCLDLIKLDDIDG